MFSIRDSILSKQAKVLMPLNKREILSKELGVDDIADGCSDTTYRDSFYIPDRLLSI